MDYDLSPTSFNLSDNGISIDSNSKYNCDNSTRKDCNRLDSVSESKNSKSNFEDEQEDDVDINVNIYRYKFTNEFTSELFKFSKIHQYDDRKVFKDAWTVWTEDNQELISSEIRRLTEIDYDGDILDKMFKSARYYFRKKSTEKKEPTKRRNYVGVQKDLLDAMDEHIKKNIKNENYKPSEGFDEFCKTSVDLLKEEVTILCRNGMTNPVEIKNKIKKTYKNRYFIIISR